MKSSQWRGSKGAHRQGRAALTLGAASLAFMGAGTLTASAQVQQVPIPEAPSVAPQVEIAGVGVGSLDLGRPRNLLPGGSRASSSRINLEDSSLLIGAAERLYRKGGIGSFSFGALATDATTSGVGMPLFVHQAFADYQTQALEAYVGRTDTPTAQIVQFPTLRGDDLVTFTNLLDPFSNGENVQEHRYANVAAVTFNQGLHSFENVHAQNLIDSSHSGGSGDAGLNSYGVSYQWLNLPGLAPVQHIVSYGGGYEHRSGGSTHGGRSDALYAGGVVNLRRSLTDRVDFRAQDVLTFGNNLRTFNNVTDTFAANANSIAGAVRYLHSPFGIPGYQVSLTAGYRSYSKVSNANSFGVALTGVKRLGTGFDAVAQYLYQRRDSQLASAYNGARTEQALQLGFVFNFDATINRHIGPRRTLVNLQHQYIPE